MLLIFIIIFLILDLERQFAQEFLSIIFTNHQCWLSVGDFHFSSALANYCFYT
jgi:hypothetical protein